MGVLLVMVQIIVTNPFSRLSKRLGLSFKGLIVLLGIMTLTLGGCEKRISDTALSWGKEKDITEDLYHRLQAGIFEVGKDPFICELIPNSSRTLRVPFKPRRTGAHEMVRITWERGSFWVQTDDHALIVIYLDEESVFGHVQVAPVRGFDTILQFRQFLETPIRDPFRSLLGM